MTELNEIFSRTPDAVFAIDEARRIVYRNQAFAEIFQRGVAEPRHRKCYDVVCGHTLDGKNSCSPDCPIGTSLTKGRSVASFDLAVPRANGESLCFSVGAIPVSGIFDGTAAVFTLRPFRVFALPLDPVRDNRACRDAALTRREQQILDLLVEGCTARSVAKLLHIRYVTARNHIQHIYEKLGIHNRAEAIRYACRRSPSR